MFEKLKKAFGFGNIDETYDDEMLHDDTDLKSSGVSPFVNGIATGGNPEVVDTGVLASEIFEHVVARFNEALPDFLKKSVDPEREKQQMYDSLSDDLKAHLTRVELAVSQRLDEAWRTERDKLQTDLRNVSQTAKDIEAKRNELKSQQLSADRQKRAMTERIHELEKRILAVEAEKEQLELEIKSMVNKVKVAQVYEKDIEELQQQIEDMKANGSVTVNAGPDTETLARIDELEQTIKTANHNNALLEEQKAQLKEENDMLTAELERLSDIENEYSQLVDKMEKVEKKLIRIDEINTSKDEKIKEYKSRLEEARKEIENKNRQIEEMTSGTPEAAVTNVAAEPSPVMPPIDMADDILTDTDWIVKPSGSKSSSNSKRNDRNRNRNRNQRDDEAQMSLW